MGPIAKQWEGEVALHQNEVRRAERKDPPHLPRAEGLLLKERHHLGEGLVGDGFDLGLGAVLDGMGDVDDGGLEAQRIALGGDAVDEARRHDVDAGEAAGVEVIEVVQTARCAGASIA